MENVQQDTDDDEHAEVRAGGNKGKDATDVPPPEKVKEHTPARGEGVLLSRRGRAPGDVGQVSPGKRSRTDPVAARRRFDFNFSFLLCPFLGTVTSISCTCFLSSAAMSLLSDNCHIFSPPSHTCSEPTAGG